MRMPRKKTSRQKPQADDAPVESSSPKTTRAPASKRRGKAPAKTTEEKIKRKLDAVPDRIDIRDWFYQPLLSPLPDQVVNIDLVPEILDQGREGACTGFALAAVINYHLAHRNLINARNRERAVSPRMIYEMARRYDEWPGEGYEGSSARGAMKGWVAHGVCRRFSWPDELHGPEHFSYDLSDEAQHTPGGAYYRVMHTNLRDMHAALNETGILYATIMVHEGWRSRGPMRQLLITFYPTVYSKETSR